MVAMLPRHVVRDNLNGSIDQEWIDVSQPRPQHYFEKVSAC